MTNKLKGIRKNKEKVWLLGYFIAIVALALPVSNTIQQGYIQGNLVRSVVRLQLLIGITKLSVIGVGFFFGLLTLMTIDRKKRIQAVLLWIGVIIALTIIPTQDIGPSITDLTNNLTWLLGSYIVGMIAGGGKRLTEFDNVQALEFRRASEIVYFLLSTIVILTFLEYHISYPDIFYVSSQGIEIQTIEDLSVQLASDNILKNSITSGAFLLVVNRFIQYDSNNNFFILGPPASGKSLFLIGAYLEALNRSQSSTDSTPLNPSEDLISMLEGLDRDTTEWIVEATGRGELNELEFQYVHGSVFPKNVTLSGFDYAGEYLQRLPDAISGTLDEDEMDTTLLRLTEGVSNSDTLLLMIDCERYIQDEPLDISPYFSILQAADNKEVILVASKTDHLAEQFEDQKGLEAHKYYEEFKEYVNTELRQNENINSLVMETGDNPIHPVYYQTTTNDQGNIIPMRDDEGSVLTVGFDTLLDKLGSE